MKCMARFKILKDESGKHTWKAEGTNPKTGKEMIIRGGQAGTAVGSKNPESEKTFDARHDATGMTPKKYINKLRWDNKAKFGSSVNIPDELFGKAAAKKASAKKAGAKSPAKKGARKATAKKSASKKARTQKSGGQEQDLCC